MHRIFTKNSYKSKFIRLQTHSRRSQWPSVLRLRSSAARLLRLWFRMPLGAWTLVCCECCVRCQLEVSATSWSLVQRSPTDCNASLCVIYKPREWGDPGPLGAVAPKTNSNIFTVKISIFWGVKLTDLCTIMVHYIYCIDILQSTGCGRNNSHILKVYKIKRHKVHKKFFHL